MVDIPDDHGSGGAGAGGGSGGGGSAAAVEIGVEAAAAGKELHETFCKYSSPLDIGVKHKK